MDKTILTTTETAQLLGISVRTAQMLIESNALTSWKTPGGHRRVYRDDVLALMSKNDQQQKHFSARVVLVGSSKHLRELEALLTKVQGCSVDIYSDVYSAALAIGLHLPAAVVVDQTDRNKERLAFLHGLVSKPELDAVKFVVIGGRKISGGEQHPNRLTLVAEAKNLPETIRSILSDPAGSMPSIEEELTFPIAINEGQRLMALQRSGLVDSSPEEVFDRLTGLASRTLNAPVALFTMLTSARQWFKSRQGLEMRETPRSWAFCNHTILQRDVFSVENLTRNARFASNPAVMGGPKFRFYAGAPVVDADGFALGSLCVIDYKPRTLNRDQKEILRSLARLTSDAVELRAAKLRPRGALDVRKP